MLLVRASRTSNCSGMWFGLWVGEGERKVIDVVLVFLRGFLFFLSLLLFL